MQHEQTGYLNNDFRTCLARLMDHGLEAHPRGTTTKELLNYNISLRNPRNRVITFPERNTNTRYLLGEFIWYLSGSNDPKGILPYSKFWDQIRNKNIFMDAYPEGAINSNYGHRLFGYWKAPALYDPSINGRFDEPRIINQWQETIDLLARDKDTRQAIINIHAPSDRHEGNLDVCCTLTLQFLIRENALHMIVNMRSQDVILGFTNDVFQFPMLQECLQVQLKKVYPDLELGHYFNNSGSMHLYDRHFEMAEYIVANEKAVDLEMVPMDEFNYIIVDALIECEKTWVDTGMLPNFDFTSVAGWYDLTPYWKNLIKAMFLKDETALHAIFGQEHKVKSDARAHADYLSGDFQGSDF
jgi:thymidylate synthase